MQKSGKRRFYCDKRESRVSHEKSITTLVFYLLSFQEQVRSRAPEREWERAPLVRGDARLGFSTAHSSDDFHAEVIFESFAIVGSRTEGLILTRAKAPISVLQCQHKIKLGSFFTYSQNKSIKQTQRLNWDLRSYTAFQNIRSYHSVLPQDVIWARSNYMLQQHGKSGLQSLCHCFGFSFGVYRNFLAPISSEGQFECCFLMSNCVSVLDHGRTSSAGPVCGFCVWTSATLQSEGRGCSGEPQLY